MIKRLGFMAAVCVALTSANVYAKEQSSDPIRIVVPYGPGGPTDTAARVLANELSKSMGTPFIVENVPGAGGLIGTQRVANAKPDGSMLLFGTVGPLTITPHLNQNVKFNPLESFAPISLVALQPQVLAVSSALNIDSVDQLIKYGKENPGRLTYSSAGLGHTTHLMGELFTKEAGIEALHVPYNGGSASLMALMSGEVNFTFDPPTTIIQASKTGKIKVLALTGQNKLAELPGVPLTSEAGLANVQGEAWFGLLAPANTPRDFTDNVSKHVAKVLGSSEVQSSLKASGFEVGSIHLDEFSKRIQDDYDMWGRIIKASNISLN